MNVEIYSKVLMYTNLINDYCIGFTIFSIKYISSSESLYFL